MGFITPFNSDLRFTITVNADGNIAQTGDTPAGSKSFTFKYFKTTDPNQIAEEGYIAPNNADSAFAIIDALVTIGLFTYGTEGMKQTIVRKLGD